MSDFGELPTRATEGSGASEEDLLVGYVEQALADAEAGLAPDLEAICAAHPELVPAVAEALGLEAVVPAPAADSDPLVGKVFAERYRIEGCIGLGAMGSVHRARDQKLERDVAIKVMHPGLFPDRQRQERFVREAKVLAALQHPAIVPIHDHGETEDGTFFFVMDLLDGVSLAEVLRFSVEDGLGLHARDWSQGMGIETGASTWLQQIVTWLADLGDALDVAHEAGIVHRDLKPSNVFITRDGRAVLLDFGIAVREGDSSLTAADTTLGTPWYMAPEQAGQGEASRPAVDIYGLGASLYHLLTKQPPYSGEPLEVIYKLQTSDPVPPQQLVKDLPRDLAAIVECALARRPAERYASIGAFAADLRAFLEHRPVAARPIGKLQRLARRIRRRPAVAIASAVAIAAVVGALLYVPLRLQFEAQQSERYDELYATVPALVCLEGYPDKRIAQSLDESARSVAVLSALLQIRPDDLATRMMRGALHDDRGDREACLADFAAICSREDTPYTRALLEGYRSSESSRALDLSALPAPATAFDRFLAGFHALRRREKGDYQRADDWLGGASELRAARDLRLLSLLILGLNTRAPKPRKQLLTQAHDAALQLEGEYGRKTARTRHVIGAALVGMKKYSEAEAPLLESLRLRPDRHGPLNNLGIVYRRRGQLQRAEAFLTKAHALRPWLWNTLGELSIVQCDRGRWDEALALAKRIPSSGSMGEAWRRPLMLARIWHRKALALWGRPGKEDRAAMRAASERAVSHYKASSANGCEEPLASAEAAVAELLATTGGEHRHMLFHTLNLWQRDLTNPVQVKNLEVLLRRDALTQLDVAMVRLYLLRLAHQHAPDDPDLPARMKDLQQELGKLLEQEK